MIVIDVHIPQRMNQFSPFEASNVSDHASQQGIAGDVERYS